MEPQTLINGLFTLAGLLGGWMLNRLWTSVDHLQSQDQSLADKVQRIEVLVAGTYVKRGDLDKALDSLGTAIFTRLDRIESKLERKVDR